MEKCISCGEKKELNANSICAECEPEIEEKIDEIVENANSENNTPGATVPDETIVSSTQSSFETTVKKRNAAAEIAKEELEPVPGEDEEEEKSFPLMKIAGFGLLAISIVGFVFTRNKAQTAQNLENEEIRHGNI